MDNKKNKLNEQLKKAENEKKAQNTNNNSEIKLDDSQRVKVLSPGRLVLKRFIRNKLAIVGTAILIFMFLFSFLGPFLYSYKQDQIFYKFDHLNVKYAIANNRTEYNAFTVDSNAQIDITVKNRIGLYISQMKENNEIHKTITDDNGNEYYLDLMDNDIYTLSTYTNEKVGEYSTTTKIAEYADIGTGTLTYVGESMNEEFKNLIKSNYKSAPTTVEYQGKTYSITSASRPKTFDISLTEETYKSVDATTPEQAFIDTVVANINNESFIYNSQKYIISAGGTTGSYNIYLVSDNHPVIVATNLAISSLSPDFIISNDFKVSTYMAMCCEDNYTVDNTEYKIITDSENSNKKCHKRC